MLKEYHVVKQLPVTTKWSKQRELSSFLVDSNRVSLLFMKRNKGKLVKIGQAVSLAISNLWRPYRKCLLTAICLVMAKELRRTVGVRVHIVH